MLDACVWTTCSFAPVADVRPIRWDVVDDLDVSCDDLDAGSRGAPQTPPCPVDSVLTGLSHARLPHKRLLGIRLERPETVYPHCDRALLYEYDSLSINQRLNVCSFLWSMTRPWGFDFRPKLPTGSSEVSTKRCEFFLHNSAVGFRSGLPAFVDKSLAGRTVDCRPTCDR